MIIDKENYYFIAPDNKNGLSVRPPRDLYLADTFEFKVNFMVDVEKCKGKSRGIVMMNGKHLGIHIWNKHLNGSVWTEDGLFNTYLDIDTKGFQKKKSQEIEVLDTTLNVKNFVEIECRFICDNRNKQITLITGDKKNTIDFTGNLIDDYKYSYIWIGCGNGQKDVEDEFRNHFYGEINFLEIKRDDKIIFQSDFKKKTEFKVFDESNSGNHLLKYNGEWY